METVWGCSVAASQRTATTTGTHGRRRESAEDFWNERPDVHGLAMNVLVKAGVAFEASVEVASKHDAQLNGAKWFVDACEFHLNLQAGDLEFLRIESGKDVIQQLDDC
jgi:hypothetical protein